MFASDHHGGIDQHPINDAARRMTVHEISIGDSVSDGGRRCSLVRGYRAAAARPNSGAVPRTWTTARTGDQSAFRRFPQTQGRVSARW